MTLAQVNGYLAAVATDERQRLQYDLTIHRAAQADAKGFKGVMRELKGPTNGAAHRGN